MFEKTVARLIYVRAGRAARAPLLEADALAMPGCRVGVQRAASRIYLAQDERLTFILRAIRSSFLPLDSERVVETENGLESGLRHPTGLPRGLRFSSISPSSQVYF